MVLSVFFGDHDSSVAFGTDDGRLLHLEAERYFRIKHLAASADQMDQLIDVGLAYLGARPADVAEVLVARWSCKYDLSAPLAIGGRRIVPTVTGHHLNHVATSFPSGFKRSIVLCADGGSEDGATSLFHVVGDQVRRIAVLDQTALTGRVYGTATQMTIQPDFITAHASDTGKMMGLAAYGSVDPALVARVQDNLPQINRVHPGGVDHLRELFEIAPTYARWPDERRRNLAATVQRLWEDTLLDVAARYRHLEQQLSIVGGCAMNVVANGRLERSGLFSRVFVPAMPTDAGQSLGALWAAKPELASTSPYLGRDVGAVTPISLAMSMAEDLVSGRVIAVCSGRSESGPRALGNRSILALPSSEEVRVRVSEEIKGREAYRPIAPVIRAADLQRLFDGDTLSPYMSFAYQAREETRRLAPAIVHIDGTSRVQTVEPEQHPLLHAVLDSLESLGHLPVIANTSMNVAGDPMVDTEEEALDFFEKTPVDVMYLGNRRLARV